MQSNVLLTCQLVLLLHLLAVCNGKKIYVSTDGLDTNSGTSDSPYKTVQKGVSSAIAGDEVIVLPGVYNEEVKFPKDRKGTKNSKITVRSQPCHSARVVSFETLKTNDHIRIECMHIQGGGKGILLGGNYHVIENNRIIGCGIGIRFQHGLPHGIGSIVSNNYLEKCSSGITVYCKDCIIESNEVTRLINPGSGDSDYSRFFGENIVFRKNYFHGSYLSDIGNSHTDCFQTWYLNSGTDYEFAKNVTIEQNYCSHMHQGIIARNTNPNSTPQTSTHHTFSIYNNVFAHGLIGNTVGGAAYGILLENIFNSEVYYNSITGIAYYGARFRQKTSVKVKNNVFFHCRYTYEPTVTIEASNNVLYPESNAVQFPKDSVGKSPLLVDPENGDFHLREGSPAIGFATDVGINVDREGLYRGKDGKFDAGCHQFNASYTPPNIPTSTTAPSPTPVTCTTRVTIEAETAELVAPFVLDNTKIVQNVQTTNVDESGKATFSFVAPLSGQYVVSVFVDAPSESKNSLFVDIDKEPTIQNIWYFEVTSGFQERQVSWGGNTAGGNPVKYFTLEAGPHKLIVRGREHTAIDKVAIKYCSLTTGTEDEYATESFITYEEITNDKSNPGYNETIPEDSEQLEEEDSSGTESPEVNGVSACSFSTLLIFVIGLFVFNLSL